MRISVLWLLLLTVAYVVAGQDASDLIATTQEGESVVLHADGTWESASIERALRLDLAGVTSCNEVSAKTLLRCVVSEVLGGDKLVVRVDAPPYLLSSTETVRLLGIDSSAPESLALYSYESYRHLRESVLGTTVYLGFDTQLRDDNGALLAYVYTEQSVCLNALVLGRGLAKYEAAHPAHFEKEFRQLESVARRQQQAIWSGRVAKVHIKALFRGQEHRYVEMANSHGSGENLDGWRLVDSAGNGIFLPATTIQPSETISIHSGTGVHRPPGSYVVPGPQMWQSTSDIVSLYDEQNVLVDRLTYPALP